MRRPALAFMLSLCWQGSAFAQPADSEAATEDEEASPPVDSEGPVPADDAQGEDAAEASESDLPGAGGSDASLSGDETLEEPSADEPAAFDEAADETESEGGGVIAEPGLFAESTASAGEETQKAGDLPSGLSLGGYVRSDFFVGLPRPDVDPTINAAYGEWALQGRAKGRLGDAFAEARLRYGRQLDEERLFFDLREAYVNTYLGALDLRLGHQIVVWGRADAFNPTNNITPVDFRIRSPIEDDRRLAQVGARGFVNLDKIRLEGIWMPLYTPTTYPHLELDELVVFVERDRPQVPLDGGLFAAKVHLELSAFDASVSYVNGNAPLPGFQLEGYGVGEDAEVRVLRTAYRQHVAGFDFATALGDVLGLRGEAAYRHPIDYENRDYAPRPDLQYVLGIDKEISSFHVIAQYLGRYTFDWQRDEEPQLAGPEVLINLTEPVSPLVDETVSAQLSSIIRSRNQMLFSQLAEVQHLASLRVSYRAFHETLEISALSLLNVTTREWLVFPRVGYDVSDQIKAYLGAEIYAGPEGTLFSVIEDTLSAAYAELRMSF